MKFHHDYEAMSDSERTQIAIAIRLLGEMDMIDAICEFAIHHKGPELLYTDTWNLMPPERRLQIALAIRLLGPYDAYQNLGFTMSELIAVLLFHPSCKAGARACWVRPQY